MFLCFSNTFNILYKIFYGIYLLYYLNFKFNRKQFCENDKCLKMELLLKKKRKKRI